ncbi:AAA family ATPase [Streptomyces sp. NPDC085927]|uniref:AAA family ATPase n=1 Tax=Streptomyces sp. NPDC085927 TaxID=3365738 RepID=UPI0037CF7CE4
MYDISSVAAELAERAGLEDVGDEPLLEADVTKPLELPPVTEDLAQQLLMPAAWLRETAQQPQEQRQLIFYGPPGTGKTYLARALAEHLAGPGPGGTRTVPPLLHVRGLLRGLPPRQGGQRHGGVRGAAGGR